MSDRTRPSGLIGDGSPLDPRALLIALNQASYDWWLETDRLSWSAGAARVLGIGDEAMLASGRAFARLLDFDAPGGRHEAILHGTADEAADGTGYCLRYACRAAGGGRRRWIEDRGRWFAGPDGRPALARGLLRVVAECEEDEASFSPRPGTRYGLGRSLAKACESGRQGALFLVCVDRLDRTEAEHGAVVADALAAQVMRSLRKVLRIGDDLVSIADGKFALVLAGCDTIDLPRAAERLRRSAAAAPVEAASGTIHASVSIGGTAIPLSGGDAGAILHRAQHALDRCGRERPGGFVVLAPGETDEACTGADRLLARALDEDRLFLAFDPVLDSAAGKIERRPAGRSLFRARAFIRTGGAGASWQPARIAGHGDGALMRRFSLRLVELADAVLARHADVELVLPVPEPANPPAAPGDARTRLTLELDEAAIRADLEQGGALARAVHASGARLGIAGFGSGHLSFDAVKALAAERITVHGALVETAAQVAQGRFALRSLVEAAVQHSVAVGAEWVDDEATARLLAAWGCDRLQGAVAGPLRLDLPRPQAAGKPRQALRVVGA